MHEPIAPRDARVAAGLEIIGTAVYEARRRAGVSQRALGGRCGMDQSTISRLERGKLNGMRLKRLAELVAALQSLTLDGASSVRPPAHPSYAHRD